MVPIPIPSTQETILPLVSLGTIFQDVLAFNDSFFVFRPGYTPYFSLNQNGEPQDMMQAITKDTTLYLCFTKTDQPLVSFVLPDGYLLAQSDSITQFSDGNYGSRFGFSAPSGTDITSYLSQLNLDFYIDNNSQKGYSLPLSYLKLYTNPEKTEILSDTVLTKDLILYAELDTSLLHKWNLVCPCADTAESPTLYYGDFMIGNILFYTPNMPIFFAFEKKHAPPEGYRYSGLFLDEALTIPLTLQDVQNFINNPSDLTVYIVFEPLGLT